MTSEDARKLFVAGLPESMDEAVLRSLFEATGCTVVNISLPRDRATSRPRGFGFVTLESSEQAQSARDALDGSVQAGRPISVRPFQSEPPKRGEGLERGPRPDGPAMRGSAQTYDAGAGGAGAPAPLKTLYVGNLPYDITPPEIQAAFTEAGAGEIARVHLPAQPDGRLRGFGFITMPSEEAASAAVAALRDAELRGRRLTVNIAHPRGERPPMGDRPRRPYAGDGGFQGREYGASTGDSMPAPSPGGFGPLEESSRPLEGRRARATEVKKKTKKKKARATVESRAGRAVRGGAGKWSRWTDWDED